MLSDNRPNRSDVHLSAEEETKIEEQTRDYFDALAPKRPSKPQRSDYSSSHHPTTTTTTTTSNPELIKFNHLQQNNDPQNMIYNGSSNNQTAAEAAEEEEYMETEYYKDLNGIDKQHHTTGTGFITVVENNNGSDFRLAPESSTVECHSACNGNPATNDWIPSQIAVPDTGILGSHKPTRSDN